MFWTLNVSGQTWAPKGAHWYYWSYDIFADTWVAKLESLGDTLFQGKNCKAINSVGVGFCTNGSETNPIILFPDSDKVYYYNNFFDKFFLLYDFTKSPGDTFYIRTFSSMTSTDSVGFRIYSTGFTDVGTFHLRTQYLTQVYSTMSYYGLYGNIIEYIGHTAFIFPIDMDMCDVSNTSSLMCYYDSIIDYHPGMPYNCIEMDINWKSSSL